MYTPLGMYKKARKELQEPEIFEAALCEEISVSSEFVILVALPNTETGDACVVEERLREAVPEATVGVASFARGGTAESLIQRAQVAGDAQIF